MPDCMINVNLNCNDILQHLRKVICCSKNSLLMFDGVSDHQDLSSTYHRAGQLSAVLRAQNGTGLSVRKLCFGLGFVINTCYSLTLSKAERNNDSLKQHSQSRASPDRDMYYLPNSHVLPYIFQAPCSKTGLREQKWHLYRVRMGPFHFLSSVPTAWNCFRWCGYQI